MYANNLAHVPSVLLSFIAKPESSLKVSNKSKNARAELKSARVAVVSSAYCSSLVSWPSIEIPLILPYSDYQHFPLLVQRNREIMSTLAGPHVPRQRSPTQTHYL